MIIIPVLIISGYEYDSINTEKKENKARISGNYINYETLIYAKDNNNLPLGGIIFKVKDFNNTIEQIIPATENIGEYSYEGEQRYTLDQIINIFPETEKNKIKNLKTKEDILVQDNSYCSQYSTCSIEYQYIPFIIEETIVPSGYIKEKYIVFASANLYILLSEENIDYMDIQLRISTHKHMKYEELINYENFIQDEDEGKYQEKIHNSCPPNRIEEDAMTSEFSIDMEEYNCGLNVIKEKGIVDLKIKNFVNEKSNITTTNNKTLKYQIQIENKGTASSTENTIVSEVPKGLEYVEDSASHDGEYNKKEHQVEWKIEEIEAEETLELTYEAIVPKDADPNIEYIGTTSINSREVQEDIKSEKTIVTLEKTPITNPKTNSFMNFILLVIPGILIFGIYLTTYKRRIN